MKYLFSLLILAFLLTNCKNNSEEEQAAVSTEDSTERLDTVFSANDIARLNEFRFSKFSAVDWSNFYMVTSSHDDSLLLTPFQPDSAYYRNYGRTLKYSPDSSMFIDLDSYNIEFQNSSGKQMAREQGPDTEVSLVNIPEKERTRLVFFGPGNGVEDGGWFDNETAVLVGYHEKDTTKTKKAVVWRYHVPTKTFHVYESADTSITVQLLRWRRERLNSLTQ